MTPSPVTQTMSYGRRVTRGSQFDDFDVIDDETQPLPDPTDIPISLDPITSDRPNIRNKPLTPSAQAFLEDRPKKRVRRRTASKRVGTKSLPSMQRLPVSDVIDDFDSGITRRNRETRTAESKKTNKRKQKLKCPPKKTLGGGLGRKFIPWNKKC